MNEILIPALIVGGAGLIFGALLAVAGFIFKVKKDERIPLIEETLPGANCGGCGFAGCSAYAEAVVSGKAECDLCAVGGEEVARYIADIMGTKSEFSKNTRSSGAPAARTSVTAMTERPTAHMRRC